MARRWERRQAVTPLPVRDKSGADLGVVTMLGIKGATIHGKGSMPVGSQHLLFIRLPASLGVGDAFEIMAECRWSRPNTSEGGFDTGVKFEPSSASQMNVLARMLESLTTLRFRTASRSMP